ncbi:hypothetical protein [Kineosporia babensis]|uniref:Uncharacterized protein n=1 Tax=Kineosporia babensis TaxID=499548 RepID=A0A9X1SZ90_9ACTN|nr:hypothetical protein [Kineosporia babensis]MCD5317200.1 hypothetical protein [Kineosporia babensis]
MTPTYLVLGILLVVAGGLMWLTAKAIPRGPSTLMALAAVFTSMTGAITVLATVTSSVLSSVA